MPTTSQTIPQGSPDSTNVRIIREDVKRNKSPTFFHPIIVKKFKFKSIVGSRVHYCCPFLFKNFYKNYHKPQNPFELET